MRITDVIADAGTDHEILFLLTAYLESVRFGDKFSLLPQHITRLPLNGIVDVRVRFRDLRAELDRTPGLGWSNARALVKEALVVFGTGIDRLTFLGQESVTSTTAAQSPDGSAPLLSNRVAKKSNAVENETRPAQSN